MIWRFKKHINILSLFSLSAQIQIVLLVILLLAIGDFVIGTFIPVDAKRTFSGLSNVDLEGYTSYSGTHTYIHTYYTSWLPTV